MSTGCKDVFSFQMTLKQCGFLFGMVYAVKHIQWIAVLF